MRRVKVFLLAIQSVSLKCTKVVYEWVGDEWMRCRVGDRKKNEIKVERMCRTMDHRRDKETVRESGIPKPVMRTKRWVLLAMNEESERTSWRKRKLEVWANRRRLNGRESGYCFSTTEVSPCTNRNIATAVLYLQLSPVCTWYYKRYSRTSITRYSTVTLTTCFGLRNVNLGLSCTTLLGNRFSLQSCTANW